MQTIPFLCLPAVENMDLRNDAERQSRKCDSATLTFANDCSNGLKFQGSIAALAEQFATGQKALHAYMLWP